MFAAFATFAEFSDFAMFTKFVALPELFTFAMFIVLAVLAMSAVSSMCAGLAVPNAFNPSSAFTVLAALAALAALAYRLVDHGVAGVGAVKGLIVAAAATAVKRHAAGQVEVRGGFWVFLGHLHADLSGPAGCSLDLLQDDFQCSVHFVQSLPPKLSPQVLAVGVE